MNPRRRRHQRFQREEKRLVLAVLRVRAKVRSESLTRVGMTEAIHNMLGSLPRTSRLGLDPERLDYLERFAHAARTASNDSDPSWVPMWARETTRGKGG